MEIFSCLSQVSAPLLRCLSVSNFGQPLFDNGVRPVELSDLGSYSKMRTMMNALAGSYILVLQSFLLRTALHLFAVCWDCTEDFELLKEGDSYARWQCVGGIFISFSSSLPRKINLARFIGATHQSNDESHTRGGGAEIQSTKSNSTEPVQTKYDPAQLQNCSKKPYQMLIDSTR